MIFCWRDCWHRDLLRCVLTEWLKWEDISQWDIACLGSSRPDWLHLLAGMTWRRTLVEGESLEDRRSWYRWTRDRHLYLSELVLFRTVEVEDVLAVEDPMVCRAVRCLLLSYEGEEEMESTFVDKVSAVLDRCVLLEEVILQAGSLVQALHRHGPALRRVAAANGRAARAIAMAADFFSRHAATLQELVLLGHLVDVRPVFGHLQREGIRLRVLTLPAFSSTDLRLFLDYLSLYGTALEDLSLVGFCHDVTVTGELLGSLFGFCPALRSLEVAGSSVSYPEVLPSLFALFQSATRLQLLQLDGLQVSVNKQQKQVIFSLNTSSAAPRTSWENCLASSSLVLHDDYELRFSSSHLLHDQVAVIVERLHPFLERFVVKEEQGVGDEALEELVRKCPRLASLSVSGSCSLLTDRTLAAIARFKPNLTELDLLCLNSFTERGLREMLAACGALVNLSIRSGEFSIIGEIAKLSRLRGFSLFLQSGEAEDVAKLLLEDELTWPSGLIEGKINLRGVSRFSLSRKCMLSAGVYPRKRCDGGLVYLTLPPSVTLSLALQ